MSLLIALVIVLALAVVLLIKLAVTMYHLHRITFAIFRYHVYEMCNSEFDENETLYKYMKPYAAVYLNFFDWTDNHILPPEKYELIKPYFI